MESHGKAMNFPFRFFLKAITMTDLHCLKTVCWKIATKSCRGYDIDVIMNRT